MYEMKTKPRKNPHIPGICSVPAAARLSLPARSIDSCQGAGGRADSDVRRGTPQAACPPVRGCGHGLLGPWGRRAGAGGSAGTRAVSVALNSRALQQDRLLQPAVNAA
ncbi:hypothetical protein NDU88_005175 [Pleurodeles waltl]|uniref:Uncharacterized protein n=1 Tax=Pleurodeles waltl TaxID=8319 RepID=A0AAV7W8W0_PLEWA|nr:hypothetical protein NDU88_005175 [Pleurodeles waltl]